MRESNTSWIVLVVAIVLVGAAAWWFLRPAPEPEPATAVPADATPAEPADRGPVHPLPSPEPAEPIGDLVELPPLSDSDGYFSLALIDLFGPELDELLVESGVIEKFVATVDNLPREKIADSIRPVGRLEGTFEVEEYDDESYMVSPRNADRYRNVVAMLTMADPDQLYAAYRRFYPLFQQAYVNLGYPDGYFNDRVVEVIDHLLAAPVPLEPVRLVRPHVLYEFADPELESLSSGEKLMIRLGPEQATAVKRVLRQFRERIT